MIFGCQYSILLTRADIHIDIQTMVSMQGHSAALYVGGTSISTIFFLSIFYGYQSSPQLSMLLLIPIWMSIDFYGYPCMDLLWILYPEILYFVGVQIHS